MFCKYCGQKIDGDSVFCKACGKNIAEESVTQEPVTQTPTYQAPIKQEPIYQAPIKQEPVIQEPVSVFVPVLETPEPEAPKPIVAPEPRIEYQKPPEKPRKPKRKKGVAPYVLLPISMLVAVITKGIVYLAGMGIMDLIFEYLLQDYTGALYTAAYNFVSVLGKLSVIFVVFLFSLCCKGFTKKIQFISSAFAGTVAYMFLDLVSIITRLDKIINDLEYWIIAVLMIVGYITIFVGCFALSVVIAILFFKKLSSYEAKPTELGEKTFKIKKMIVPGALITLAAVFSPIYYEVINKIYEIVEVAFSDVEWAFIRTGRDLATDLLPLGILLASIFILKNKYRALSCVAAASVGANFPAWTVLYTIYCVVLEISKQESNHILWTILRVISIIVGIFFGIAFYILLNRKEMKEIGFKK